MFLETPKTSPTFHKKLGLSSKILKKTVKPGFQFFGKKNHQPTVALVQSSVGFGKKNGKSFSSTGKLVNQVSCVEPKRWGVKKDENESMNRGNATSWLLSFSKSWEIPKLWLNFKNAYTCHVWRCCPHLDQQRAWWKNPPFLAAVKHRVLPKEMILL